MCRDARTSLETLIRPGVDRVLTSGRQAMAWDGRDGIAALVRQSSGRIAILAGGGIHEDHAAELVRATGVTELHVRAATPRQDADPRHKIPFRKALPTDESVRDVTDPVRIAAIRRAVSRKQPGVDREGSG